MHTFLRHVFFILLHLGGFGLLILGILDSSFLFMPLGNDLLIVALTARKHGAMPYYAAMATAGSVLGCLLVDLAARKGGEEGLEKFVPAKRLEYVKKKVSKSAGVAVAFASLMPPPFPFTPFVAGAAAFQYPRKKLLTVIGLTRFIRFSAEGVLAIFLGSQVLQLAKQPWVEWAITALIVLAVGGSILSIITWIRRARRMDPGRGGRRVGAPRPSEQG